MRAARPQLLLEGVPSPDAHLQTLLKKSARYAVSNGFTNTQTVSVIPL